MLKASFVVDRTLRAISLDRVLDVRDQLRDRGSLGTEAPSAADRAVLEHGAELRPGVLYPSSSNPSVRYFLPAYRVLTDGDGRPRVKLEYLGDDVEVGRLSLTLTWDTPSARNVEVRMIDHVAALTLSYSVPFKSEEGQPAASGSIEEFVELQPLSPTGGGRAESTTVFADKAQFRAVYQAMREPAFRASLTIRLSARVGVRTWKQVVVGRPAAAEQFTAMTRRGALFTRVLNTETLGTIRMGGDGNRARMTLKPAAPDTEAAMDATRAALLERAAMVHVARPRAVLATADPRPVAVSPALIHALSPAIRASLMQPTPVAARPVATPTRATAVASPLRTSAALSRASLRPEPVATDVTATHVGPTASAHTRVIARSLHVQPHVAARMLTRINAPTLKEAVASSDLKLGGRTYVPVEVALDKHKRPAIVDVDMTTESSIPFAFPPSRPQNAAVYAADGLENQPVRFLIARTLVAPDGSTHHVFQDSLLLDVVHIAPTAFRLDRDPSPPFLPRLSFVVTDFGTTDDEVEAEVIFRAAVVYELEPWVDPAVIELARQTFAAENVVPRFTTIVPRGARLQLGGEVREGATVDPAAGIRDTLELDQAAFASLLSEKLALPGGLTGSVEFDLFDGTTTAANVRMSLQEETSGLFDVSFAGGVADRPGHYKIVIRNRIESPVEVTSLPGMALAPNVTAQAVDAAQWVGRTIEPAGQIELEYRVSDPEFPVSTLDPVVLAAPKPDVAALLGRLIVTPGYASLAFSVSVEAVNGVFGPPADGEEALSGLLVEFDDGSQATLSPDLMRTEVTLLSRIIDQIFGGADRQQRYFYRVTNLHLSGEGARTGWREGQGSGTLRVGAAVVQLDF